MVLTFLHISDPNQLIDFRLNSFNQFFWWCCKSEKDGGYFGERSVRIHSSLFNGVIDPMNCGVVYVFDRSIFRRFAN